MNVLCMNLHEQISSLRIRVAKAQAAALKDIREHRMRISDAYGEFDRLQGDLENLLDLRDQMKEEGRLK